MHDTAHAIGAMFLKTYAKIGDSILDVGSLDVNGTLRDAVPNEAAYVGADVVSGKNVDIVLDSPHRFQFQSNRFNIVISTSCLEHDDFFWLTFSEMARVLAPGGFIYINAPTNGPVHRHPIDCWRFYPDAGKALSKWSKRCGHEVSLIESFFGPVDPVGWIDFVAVFGKPNFATPIRSLRHQLF
jgi:SAM-dependent methyltransferase